MATIPKRMSELLEEQKYASGLASGLNDFALGSDAVAAAQGGLDPVSDVEAGAADVAAGAVDVGEEAAPEVESLASKAWSGIKGFFGDGGASTTADTATTTADTASTAGSGLYDAAGNEIPSTLGNSAETGTGSTGGGLLNRAKDLVTSPAAKGAIGTEAGNLIKDKLTGHGSNGQSNSGTYQGGEQYGGSGSSVNPVRVSPMFQASKRANSFNEEEILNKVDQNSKLLEMILEVLCKCGQPTSGSYNGMPHCIPGTGCAANVAGLPNNRDGDACCSCGDKGAAGSFHGQTICAPGQGCNSHWDAKNGRKWNPIMESPQEKIQDHDDWASQTNHGEFDMPGPKKPIAPTSWV